MRKLVVKQYPPIAEKYKLAEITIVCLLFLIFNMATDNTIFELLQISRPYFAVENKNHVELSYTVKAITKPNATVAVVWAGIVPYFTQRYSVDLLGKTEKVISHEQAKEKEHFDNRLKKYISFFPGHMKWDYPYVAKTYKPDIVIETWGDASYLLKDYNLIKNYKGRQYFILKETPRVQLQ